MIWKVPERWKARQKDDGASRTSDIRSRHGTGWVGVPFLRSAVRRVTCCYGEGQEGLQDVRAATGHADHLEATLRPNSVLSWVEKRGSTQFLAQSRSVIILITTERHTLACLFPPGPCSAMCCGRLIIIPGLINPAIIIRSLDSGPLLSTFPIHIG